MVRCRYPEQSEKSELDLVVMLSMSSSILQSFVTIVFVIILHAVLFHSVWWWLSYSYTTFVCCAYIEWVQCVLAIVTLLEHTKLLDASIRPTLLWSLCLFLQSVRIRNDKIAIVIKYYRATHHCWFKTELFVKKWHYLPKIAPIAISDFH